MVWRSSLARGFLVTWCSIIALACGVTAEDGASSGSVVMSGSGGTMGDGGGASSGSAPGGGEGSGELISLFTGESITGSCIHGYLDLCEEYMGSIHDEQAVKTISSACAAPDESHGEPWLPPDTPILDIVWRADEPCPRERAISSCHAEGHSLKVYYEGASSVSSMACGATFETYDGDE